MTMTTADLFGSIAKYKNNPLAAHRAVLDAISAVRAGTEIAIDPVFPFFFGIQANAVNTAVYLDELASVTRRLYPSAAQTPDDLYRHMSDMDYVGIFALPAPAEIMIAIDIRDLEEILIEDAATKIRQVVIPRNTIFTVSGLTFSLQYPVSIRKHPHTGFQVIYINDKPSPLVTLSTNAIEWDLIDTRELTYLRFTLQTHQFKIATQYDTVSYSSGGKYSFQFEDEFIMARVYTQDRRTSAWKEIRVTYTDQVYDPKTPTVCANVQGQRIYFSIPPVYIYQDSIKGKIRYDIYTCKGKVTIDLNQYGPEQYHASFNAIDPADMTPEVAALKSIKSIFLYSKSKVDGGRSALTFEELKNRTMINAVGPRQVPITPAQVKTDLVDYGYKVRSFIDVLTNRVFQASKSTPLYSAASSDLLTPATTSMPTVWLNLSEVSQAPGVFDNTTAITLTPNTLYRTIEGVTRVVSSVERQELENATPLGRANLVNQRNYFYSPFTYVLDAAREVFEVRAYDLDAPEVITKHFVTENATAGWQASFSKEYGVFKVNDGFLIELRTKSSREFQLLSNEEVVIQLSYIPVSKVNRVYATGQLVDIDETTGERTYQFKINSNFHVTPDDLIEFTSFAEQESGINCNANLKTAFDIFVIVIPYAEYGTLLPENYKQGTIEDLIGRAQLPVNRNYYPITHERITVSFGQRLKNLWTQSRSAVGTLEYERYAHDVVTTYQNDVYEVDPATGTTFMFTPEGKVQSTQKLHSKGDPVLDDLGQEIILHHKGDLVIDPVTNTPVPITNQSRRLDRFCDILMIEGAYFFANDAASVQYKDDLRRIFNEWVTQELPEYEKVLLDKTSIYFYPEVTSGTVTVITSTNVKASIDSAQSLSVTLHVPPTVMDDEPLKRSLEKITILTIAECFQSATVSTSNIEDCLLKAYGGDVINVELKGVAGESNYPVVTVLDDVARLGIRKKLTMRPDKKYTVTEAVSVTFVKHGERIQ